VWSGYLSAVERNQNGGFEAELLSLSADLQRPIGRVIQRRCDAELGDARCGVDIADPAFRATGVVAAVIDEQRFTASGLAGFEDGWFEHGRLDWTSGANQDLSAFVKTHARAGEDASVALWLPAGAPIKAGDAFAIIAGCDKRHETCRDKFSNLVNFRGFHLMPGNDFAVSYPARGEALDGGRRR
ncbi:MAG: phage BR0599 family protein, partial [Pseudomonadota bacterium]